MIVFKYQGMEEIWGIKRKPEANLCYLYVVSQGKIYSYQLFDKFYLGVCGQNQPCVRGDSQL